MNVEKEIRKLRRRVEELEKLAVAGRRPVRLEAAMEFLKEHCENKETRVSKLLGKGFNYQLLIRAKRKLGYQTIKIGNVWHWSGKNISF